jgi:hypothetical protein
VHRGGCRSDRLAAIHRDRAVALHGALVLSRLESRSYPRVLWSLCAALSLLEILKLRAGVTQLRPLFNLLPWASDCDDEDEHDYEHDRVGAEMARCPR